VNLPLNVRSDYYRALLVLLRRDRVIHPRERDLMIRIGEMLDFDRRFCEAAINDLLSNAHITRTPVIFADENIKDCFFRDALRVALVDGEFHPRELSWLRRMARANGRSDRWLDLIIEESLKKQDEGDSAPLQIQNCV
jgi:hypothetical protein